MKKVTFNKDWLRDKIYACWMGKNIGGTMGTPYEGTKELLDIKGFVTKPGEALINDDLDLQLVWLQAMEEVGPTMLNERVLGEYWIDYITPHWNEYGVCKSNMKEGIAPPLSGEFNNEEWRHSNGAWIRTEIWACLYPGDPETAVRYAYYDACVDHGYGEGTYGAMFVEAIESAAFIIDDINVLLKIGLSKIPADCRVARSVRLVMDEYAKGTDWKDVRQALIKESEDLGWFQAPANIAYVVLGLLYGGCDFKKSMILAINCGDDTDCTGATVGALLGIMYGMKGIPEDWRQYLGDNITIGCIAHGSNPYPKTCTALTEAVMRLLPVTQLVRSTEGIPVWDYAPRIYAELTDGDNDFSGVSADDFCGDIYAKLIGARKRYSFMADSIYAEVLVELDAAPMIKAGGTLTGDITIRNKNMPAQKHYRLRWLTENGFTVTGDMNLHAHALRNKYKEPSKGSFCIQAPESVPAVTRLVLEISVVGHFTPIYIPITILG